MPDATADDVRCVDTLNQLGKFTDPQLDCFITTEALCYFGNTAVWSGKCRITAMALVAAHIAFRSLQGAVAPFGQVTSQAAGGLSRTFGTSSSSSSREDWWKSTEFGRRYLELRATRLTTPLVLGAC